MAELVRKLHLRSGGLLEGVATFSEDDPGGRRRVESFALTGSIHLGPYSSYNIGILLGINWFYWDIL